MSTHDEARLLIYVIIVLTVVDASLITYLVLRIFRDRRDQRERAEIAAREAHRQRLYDQLGRSLTQTKAIADEVPREHPE